MKGQGHRGQRSNLSFFLFSSVYVLFEIVCVCVCVRLICLHHRNHLTATSRRVKFTSIDNNKCAISQHMRLSKRHGAMSETSCSHEHLPQCYPACLYDLSMLEYIFVTDRKKM